MQEIERLRAAFYAAQEKFAQTRTSSAKAEFEAARKKYFAAVEGNFREFS